MLFENRPSTDVEVDVHQAPDRHEIASRHLAPPIRLLKETPYRLTRVGLLERANEQVGPGSVSPRWPHTPYLPHIPLDRDELTDDRLVIELGGRMKRWLVRPWVQLKRESRHRLGSPGG